MTTLTGYPPANKTVQNFSGRFASSRIEPNVGVIHDTETMSWPDYSGGATAPHYTALPRIKAKTFAWRQHYQDTESARALRNLAGGVETNTLNVLQIEIIGTCSAGVRDTWRKRYGAQDGVDFIYLPDAPDWFHEQLAEFMVWANEKHGIKVQAAGPIDAAGRWPAYPASINAARMTYAEWRNFYGWLGHMHAPENVHGDPGALKIRRTIAMAKDMLQPEPRLTRVALAREDILNGVEELDSALKRLDLVPDTRRKIAKMADELLALRNGIADLLESNPER